jgi:hypothetical protein
MNLNAKLALLWAAAAAAIVVIGVLLIGRPSSPPPLFQESTTAIPEWRPTKRARVPVAAEPPAPARPKPSVPRAARKDPKPPGASTTPSLLEQIKNCKDDPTCGLPVGM